MDQPLTYLIIGCGRFGSRAAEKLSQKETHSMIIVVDKSKKKLQKVAHLPIQTEVCDGIIYLHQFLSEGQKADYIIPAVPFHLAFEFILSQLKPLGAKRRLEDCSEPLHCSVTGEHRFRSLFRMLMNLSGPFESKVIHSYQLGKEVEGFR